MPITVELQPIGQPCVDVVINNKIINYSVLSHPITITDFYKLLDPLTISIVLSKKYYTTEYETAVIIARLSIDNINIIPTYNHLIDYQNDHNINAKTNYLGYNGKWALTIDRPFYQWLHRAQNQGWLLT
jgi:hypothetical protein